MLILDFLFKDASERLKALELELKEKTAIEAKAKASTKGITDEIENEGKKKKALEKVIR